MCVSAIQKAKDSDAFSLSLGLHFFFNISCFYWHGYEMWDSTHRIATIPIFDLSLCPTHSSDSYHLSVCSFHTESLTVWRNCPLQCSRPTERCRALLPFRNKEGLSTSAGQMPRKAGWRILKVSTQRPGLSELKWLHPVSKGRCTWGNLPCIPLCIV